MNSTAPPSPRQMLQTYTKCTANSKYGHKLQSERGIHAETLFQQIRLRHPRYNNPKFSLISSTLNDVINQNAQKAVAPFYYKPSSDQGIVTGPPPLALERCSRDSHWKWSDLDHIRLPFSPRSQMIGKNDQKWDKIVNVLSWLRQSCTTGDVSGSMGEILRAVIQSYCYDASQKSNFKMLSRPDLTRYLINVLPHIVDFALMLPSLLAEPIPVLKSGENKTIYLTRRLCCSLLANAFFCTFPESKRSNYRNNGDMPYFNFFLLFNDTQTPHCEVKKEKIKCILNYFLTFVTLDSRTRDQIVSFERRCGQNWVDWKNLTTLFCNVKVETKGKIEDATGMLQCDFANKIIGGGVLNEGSVMEEIRFCISPELIVSRLFVEEMSDNEVVIIAGSLIYNKYSGYSTSFKFRGSTSKELGGTTDEFGRTSTQVVAMDALSYKKGKARQQFQQWNINRELNKCYVAFLPDIHVSPVATGNWGCGVFNGDPDLKFLIQWMAASKQDRGYIHYYTVGDRGQSKAIQDIVELLNKERLTVGKLYQTLCEYQSDGGKKSVFQYIRDKFGNPGGGGGRLMNYWFAFIRRLFW